MPTYIQMKEIRGEPVEETIGTDVLRRGQERAALTAVHSACIRFAEALGGGRRARRGRWKRRRG